MTSWKALMDQSFTAHVSQEAEKKRQQEAQSMNSPPEKAYVEKFEGVTKNIGHLNCMLYVGNCWTCEFTVPMKTAKMVIETCKASTFRIKAPIVTGTLELVRCENVTVILEAPVATIQVDMCANIYILDTTGSNLETLWISTCVGVMVAVPPKACNQEDPEIPCDEEHKDKPQYSAAYLPVDPADVGDAAWHEEQFKAQLDHAEGKFEVMEVERGGMGYVMPSEAEEKKIREQEKILIDKAYKAKSRDSVATHGGVTFLSSHILHHTLSVKDSRKGRAPSR
jgi:hypothetical protein